MIDFDAYEDSLAEKFAREYTDSPNWKDVVEQADAELRGTPLSPDEYESAGKLMLPYRVTVTVPNRIPEQLSILAASSCDAVIRAFDLLFPDFDSVKPHGGLKVAVEPVRAGRVWSHNRRGEA